MSIRIAVVQQEHNPGQVEVNRARALAAAEEALGQGADIILFHEELLVGYVPHPHDLAEPADGPTTQAFQRLLAGTDSLILYGLTEVDGQDHYISAILVGSDGVRARYRKTHLWASTPGMRCEPDHYKAGNEWVTFSVKGAKAGVMICYDGDFPETARSYAVLGCDLLFWMNNREQRGYDAETAALASKNSLILAVSCCCGTDEIGQACPGGSHIVDARGRLVTELWDAPGILYADVQPEACAALRAANPWFNARRPELYL